MKKDKTSKYQDVFLDAFEWEPLVKDNSQILYRYVENKYYNDIVLNKGLSLRFSDIFNFVDKTEAKIINKYYKKAINNLIKEELISNNVYERLKSININDSITKDFICYKNGIGHYASFECKVYIYCLSRKKNSHKMLNRYGKNSKCIGIYIPNDNILRSFCASNNNTYRVEKYGVLYGSEAIKYIENKILEIIKKEYEDFETNISFIRDLLNDMRCYCKKSCYKYEDEVRLVLYENKETSTTINEDIKINNYLSKKVDKRYVYLFLKEQKDMNIKAK